MPEHPTALTDEDRATLSEHKDCRDVSCTKLTSMVYRLDGRFSHITRSLEGAKRSADTWRARSDALAARVRELEEANATQQVWHETTVASTNRVIQELDNDLRNSKDAFKRLQVSTRCGCTAEPDYRAGSVCQDCFCAVSSEVTALAAQAARLQEALRDVIELADMAMREANRDGGEFDRVEDLREARAVLRDAEETR